MRAKAGLVEQFDALVAEVRKQVDALREFINTLPEECEF